MAHHHPSVQVVDNNPNRQRRHPTTLCDRSNQVNYVERYELMTTNKATLRQIVQRRRLRTRQLLLQVERETTVLNNNSKADDTDSSCSSTNRSSSLDGKEEEEEATF